MATGIGLSKHELHIRASIMTGLIFAVLSALLMALSQLTSWGWLALVGYAPLIWATRHASPKQAFKLFFFATVLQYMATLYWLMITMTVFGHMNLILSAFALLLVTMVIAFYLGGAAALARYISLKLGWSYFCLFPVALCLTEYLRDYGFIGSFPWGASGYSLLSIPVLVQGASVVGVYGLVFYIGLVNSAIVSRNKTLISVAISITLVLLSYGTWRLQTYDINSFKTVRVALLQGNIEQGIKNQSALYGDEILARYRALQNQAVAAGAEIVIWPESSYPYRLRVENPQFVSLGDLGPINIIPAIAEDSQDQFYNAAYVLNSHNEIMKRYDKSHLVPFGEYVPWPFGLVAKKIVPNLGEFSRGKDLKPVVLKGVSTAVTVCYEGVFPNISRNFVAQGAQLLINVTNDAWYGVSAGPYQHLNMYKMRSIETGRSFARATNTGVSAWVDPIGYTHGDTGLYEEALVVADVPLATETTFYVRAGDFVPLFCGLILLLVLIFIRRPQSKSDWLWALLGLSIILASHAYFEPLKLDLQESATTKDSLFLIIGFLLGLRVWK
ncbi:MAG: apolipoprotein N-acyltransferase [Myxococcaceae bacterium]